MRSLNGLIDRFLSACAKHTKRVHIIVYVSVWVLFFSFLRLISGRTAHSFVLALTLGFILSAIIAIIFWGIPLCIMRWRGKEKGNLLGIVNVFLLQFIALPCFSLGMFTFFAGVLLHDANPPTAFGGKEFLLPAREKNELITESIDL